MQKSGVMKKSICLLSFLSYSIILPALLYSQNVGIGISNPMFKLDVRNGSINTDSVYRIGGGSVLSIKGNENTFVGIGSGSTITSGAFNAAIGFGSLFSNTTGIYNSASGYQTLYSNTTGHDNTATGVSALRSNTIGSYNTAHGVNALYYNTNGQFNTANGYLALYLNTSGSDNTAIGESALFANTTAFRNTATGVASLYNNTSGDMNSAFGYQSLLSNTTGFWNVAAGGWALYSNSTGNTNTAIGVSAMYFNTTGNSNTAIGMNALRDNVTGWYNTVIGLDAMKNSLDASYNTVVGYRAGYNKYMGYNNTLLGAEAEVSFSGQYNSIAIGNGALCPDNSTVRIGNSANWSYGGYANWSNISDGRFKKNVREDVAGLDFIKRLRPVTYQIDVSGLSSKLNENKTSDSIGIMKTAIAEKERMIWTGFIAQEVEEAAIATGFNFSGVDKPKTEDGMYGLRYAEFVVPLVKAIQEQQLLIETQSKQVELLKAKIVELERVNDLTLKRMEKLDQVNAVKK